MTMEYSCWSDLPSDPLNLIYAKIVSMLQRVRFAAVCSSWRDAARIMSRHMAALPALPCHISSSFGGRHNRTTRMYFPEDGEVLVARPRSKAEVSRFVGAFDGGWVAALTCKHMKLVISNIFSGVEVTVSFNQGNFVPLIRRDGRCTIQKIVFSKAPTSSDCILAALTYSPGDVALCRVSRPEDDWWIITPEHSRFEDIAFCNGELYGVTTYMELFRFDITSEGGATSVLVTRLLSGQLPPPAAYGYTKNRNHLFVLGSQLAMARTWWYSTMHPVFKVFQLTYDHPGKTAKWEVTSIGEHALFLGQTCSTSVRVQAGCCGRVERNCIYMADALCLDNGICINHSQEKERRIKVVHASRYGMWLIPPCV